MNFSRSGEISPERRTFCEPLIGDKDDMLVAARRGAQAMKVSWVKKNCSDRSRREDGGRLVSKKCLNWLWQAV